MIDRFLSYSQIKQWLACRRAWAYRFRDGYKPKIGKTDFMRGSLLHAGMEHGLVDGLTDAGWVRAVAAWNREWKVDPVEWMGFEEFTAGCRKIVEGALADFRQNWLVLSDAKGPMIERRFYVDLPGWKGLVFVPDVIARRLTGPYCGGAFGVDVKSFGKPKQEFAGECDLQGCIYQKGGRMKGLDLVGTVLYQVAAAPPKEPRVNKDGSTHAGDAAAAGRWSPTSGEILTIRPQEFLDNVWEAVVIPAAKEIAAAQAGDEAQLIIPNLSYYECLYCEYKGPCLGSLKGHDEAAILADQYNRRESAPERGK
jgi:hypothetical protein